jgi:hypothetical protein
MCSIVLASLGYVRLEVAMPGKKGMKLETRVFDLYPGRYRNLTELAKAMGISGCQVSRVSQGQRRINQKFIIGAVKAFPEHKLDDLFMLLQTEAKMKGPLIRLE